MPRKQKQSRATPPWAMQAQPQLTTLYDAKGRALLVSLHGGAPHLAGLTVGKRRRPVRIAGMEDAASEASSRRSKGRRTPS